MNFKKLIIVFFVFLLFTSLAFAWKPLTTIYIGQKVSNNSNFLAGVIAPDVLVTVPTARDYIDLSKKVQKMLNLLITILNM